VAPKEITAESEFKKPVWEDLPERRTIPTRGLLINIDGAEGCGKSSLALTLAELGKVGYIDIDQSVDRAQRPKMPKGKKAEIRVLSVRYAAGLGEDLVKKSCIPAWRSMKSSALELTKSWATGGMIADTGTELWELLRLGAFGSLTPQGRTDRLYGPVNAEFRQFLRNIHRNHGRHLVVVNQMKDEYADKMVNGKKESLRTGNLTRVGFKELGYLADMTLRCFKEDGEFKVRIEMCKLAPHGPSLEGSEFDGDDVNLPRLLATITDTEVADWVKK